MRYCLLLGTPLSVAFPGQNYRATSFEHFIFLYEAFIERMGGAFGRWGYDEVVNQDLDQLKMFKSMMEDGVVLDIVRQNSEGRLHFSTDNPVVAEKYGMQLETEMPSDAF